MNNFFLVLRQIFWVKFAQKFRSVALIEVYQTE